MNLSLGLTPWLGSYHQQSGLFQEWLLVLFYSSHSFCYASPFWVWQRLQSIQHGSCFLWKSPLLHSHMTLCESIKSLRKTENKSKAIAFCLLEAHAHSKERSRQCSKQHKKVSFTACVFVSLHFIKLPQYIQTQQMCHPEKQTFLVTTVPKSGQASFVNRRHKTFSWSSIPSGHSSISTYRDHLPCSKNTIFYWTTPCQATIKSLWINY